MGKLDYLFSHLFPRCSSTGPQIYVCLTASTEGIQLVWRIFGLCGLLAWV
jgi:hypothetical protein